VQKALAKEPSARYRNAGQLAHILRSQLAPRLPEPTAPRPSQTVGRLVVPPPPAPHEVQAAPAVQATREAYGPVTEEDEWVEEAAGPDWLLIGLLILAFIAVLGLIPLWRTVYRRYTVPPPALESSHVELDVQSLELDDFGLVWYNLTWLRSAAAKVVPDLALQPGWKNVSLAAMDVRRVAVWHGS
jgi:hypothetical protein